MVGSCKLVSTHQCLVYKKFRFQKHNYLNVNNSYSCVAAVPFTDTYQDSLDSVTLQRLKCIAKVVHTQETITVATCLFDFYTYPVRGK